MAIKLTQRITRIPASPTLAIAAKAKQLKADGIDVLSFSAGEPDFNTPSIIVEAAKQALDGGAHKYTPVPGTPKLRKEICAYVKRRHDLDYDIAEVVVSCGAKHSLYNAFQAIIEPGDEVLVPAPAWVSYPTQIEMADGVPVIVPTEASNDFIPSIEALEAAVTPRTRAFVLNSPSNPSGGVWSRDGMLALAEWLRRHPALIVISDSIYDELVYDGETATELLTLAPDLRDRYVLINGVSKSFAMTGWRIGFACAPAHVASAMTRLQSQSTSNPNAVAQAASITAFRNSEELVPPMRAKFQKRRDLILAELREIGGVDVRTPSGAFYVFPDFSAFIGKTAPDGTAISDDIALASWLLERARVATVPGSPFGSAGFLRFSYATNEATIREGVRRIAEALLTLR
ncbi:MAG: aspartate aminotransferase [Bradymonadia bacterium]|jgi:aspartate aminotransferase